MLDTETETCVEWWRTCYCLVACQLHSCFRSVHKLGCLLLMHGVHPVLIGSIGHAKTLIGQCKTNPNIPKVGDVFWFMSWLLMLCTRIALVNETICINTSRTTTIMSVYDIWITRWINFTSERACFSLARFFDFCCCWFFVLYCSEQCSNLLILHTLWQQLTDTFNGLYKKVTKRALNTSSPDCHFDALSH